ncbi:MAG TPA: DUF4012 domain-containing protein [Actinomycetes bacterium]
MQRRWWLVLGVLVVAGLGLVGAQAARQGQGARTELAASRERLARASSSGAGTLADRLALVDEAAFHAERARVELSGGAARMVAVVPFLGRDVRVAQQVAVSAGETVQATREAVTALEPLQHRPPDAAVLGQASQALLGLHQVLERGHDRVERARPLLASRGARREFLAADEAASRAAFQAGQGLKLAARLWGPAGSARYFLAFQNPAELRGTGGLIGEYGILEAGPGGPQLGRVAPFSELDQRVRDGVALGPNLPQRYERFPVSSTFWAVNIPADLPTVGETMVRLYQQATGQRLDGVIAIDPLAVAEILRVAGPVTVGGVSIDADNVTDETLVHAYVRYERDVTARKAFLEEVAKQAMVAFRRALPSHPVELVNGLARAARGRHLQLFSTDADAERALVGIGIAGSTTAPSGGDYLMPVGVNTAGNKLDAFLQRNVRYQVRLLADGGARARIALTLRNGAPASGLPRYIIGPFDARFRSGENSQFQTIHVAGAYGLARATVDGRPAEVETQAELGGLSLSQSVDIQARQSVTLGFDLVRKDAVEVLSDNRIRYRLLLRPQATVHPDQVEVAVSPPPGWRFAGAPPGGQLAGATASWSGQLDQERSLTFELVPTT